MKRLSCLLLCIIFIACEFSFAAIVSDNDGSAFVTKSEFEALKANFESQIDNYNKSIDNKIDGAIASYLASMNNKMDSLVSIINRLPAKRRTYVAAISNPTTCTQDDFYIETSGFWFICRPVTSAAGTYGGYAICGLNNLETGHNKKLWPKNNGKTSKYLFIDSTTINSSTYYYLTANTLKLLKYYIYMFGSQVADTSEFTSARTYGGPTSITWTNTYNTILSGSRKVTSQNDNVPTTETLMLQVANSGSEITWIDRMGGSTIYTANSGCLLEADRLNWSYQKSNFGLGYTAQQSRWGKHQEWGCTNNYNPTTSTTKINLNFKIPKITMFAGSNLIVPDVSNLAGEPVYYYSGLPLCRVPKSNGKLYITLKPTINKNTSSATSGVTIMIKSSKFGNKAIGSESGKDIYYNKSFAAGSVPNEIKIEIDEEDIASARDQVLWVKANATNTNCTVTLETTSIMYG